MPQYQNTSTGQSLHAPPGTALPTGAGMWQPIGGSGGILQGGQLVPVAAPVGTGRSDPPFLNSYQFRMLAMGFLLGFGLVYVPFLLKGWGIYDPYYMDMGMKSGVPVGGVFCAFGLLRQFSIPNLFKAVIVLAISYVVFRYLMPIRPVLPLLRHLY